MNTNTMLQASLGSPYVSANPFTLNIPANVVRTLCGAKAKKDPRYYLLGIYIDPEGWLVALNGSVMAVYRMPEWDEEAFREFSCNKDIVFSLGKTPTESAGTQVLTLAWESLSVGQARWGDNLTPLTMVEDAKYPNWRAVDAWQTSGEWIPGMGRCGMHGLDIGLLYPLWSHGWAFQESEAWHGSYRARMLAHPGKNVPEVDVTIMGMRL